MMNKKNTSVKPVWIDEFETLYITTYQTLYRHGKLIFNQEEKVRELLILTYMEAYQRSSHLPVQVYPQFLKGQMFHPGSNDFLSLLL